MRKAGQAKADKKADRTAAEGIIVMKHEQPMWPLWLKLIVKPILWQEIHNFKEFAKRCWGWISSENVTIFNNY